MPFIEESDLLELHKDIDKAQIINERLLDQIKYKNKELKRSKIQRNLFGSITVLFFNWYTGHFLVQRRIYQVFQL